MKKVSFIVFGTILVALGYILGGYFSDPKVQSEATLRRELPNLYGVAGRSSYACQAIMGDFIHVTKDHNGSLSMLGAVSEGTDDIAIEYVDADTLHFQTTASIRAGITRGDDFSIVRDDGSVLMAIWLPGIPNGSFSTFTLDKASGLAVWSRVRAGTILSDYPLSGSDHLICW